MAVHRHHFGRHERVRHHSTRKSKPRTNARLGTRHDGIARRWRIRVFHIWSELPPKTNVSTEGNA